MAGWNLKSGSITDYNPDDDKLWSLFNYVFSDSCPKRNSYKFGLIKSLLDNAFNGTEKSEGVFYSYRVLFSRFVENYWNLVVKYDLRQMRRLSYDCAKKPDTLKLKLKNAGKNTRSSNGVLFFHTDQKIFVRRRI